jgi:hypothetical protein
MGDVRSERVYLWGAKDARGPSILPDWIDGQRELSDGCRCAKYYNFLYVVVAVARGVAVIPKSNPSLWSLECHS